MNFSEFQKATQAPEPVYLLIAAQDYLKKRVFEYCREQVQEGTETFNWRVYDLNHDSISDLLNTARTLLGARVTLVQTMLLMKPPEISGPKVWHQDCWLDGRGVTQPVCQIGLMVLSSL